MATIITSKDRRVEFGEGFPTVIIGERINPTGKKRLAEDLSQGKLDVLVQEAISQKEAGADILDVNVAASGVDETTILRKAVLKVLEVSGLPVCIDSSNPEALKKALEVYPYKALVNSVTGQEKSLKDVLPLVKKFGASVVGLTMDDSGIPKTADKRFAVAKRIIEVAESYNIPREIYRNRLFVLSPGCRDRFGSCNPGDFNQDFPRAGRSNGSGSQQYKFWHA